MAYRMRSPMFRSATPKFVSYPKMRSEEHTSELQSQSNVVCRLLLEKIINIYGNVDGKDLGYVADHIQKLVDASKKNLPRGSFINVLGQISTMHDSLVVLYL